MRNENGDYLSTRLMKQTGALLQGLGKTKEESRELLRNEIKKYREAMVMGLYLQPTGEKVRSPGFVTMQSPTGLLILRQNDARTVDVQARPDLAKYIQNGRAANYPKGHPKHKTK